MGEIIEVLISSVEVLADRSKALNMFNAEPVYLVEKIKVLDELVRRGKHWSDIKTYNYICGSMAPLPEVEDKNLIMPLRTQSADAYKVIIELK